MRRKRESHKRFFWHQAGYRITCAGMLLPGGLYAEVIRDGTIGPDHLIQPTGPHFQIPAEFGAQRGPNLFHSFTELSVSKDQSATFTGITGVDNIIARVTGPNASTIDGPLRATASADIYLLNPRGILFGPNAKLDLHGAFYASTAEGLAFFNGEVFSAVPDGGAPLLSTAAPAQFGFLSPASAPIELQGSAIKSPHDVTLNAGVIALSGGATITTATDRPDSGADVTLSAAERIIFSGTGDENGAGAGLDAGSRGDGAAGTIRIEAPIVELRDGAVLSTSTSSAGKGGVLSVTAGERITLAGHDGNGVSSRLQAESHGSGDAGMLRIDAPVIELQDGAQFTTVAHGSGNGGELLVTAAEQLTLSGKDQKGLGANLQAGTTAAATGKGGTLRVDAPLIELQDGARLSTSTDGAGRGGDLFVTARDRVTLSGTDVEGSGARLQANARGTGDAGAIQVIAPVITLQNGAAMEANTGGNSTGRGGTLTVTATDQLILSGADGNGFASSLQAIANGEGAGGTLRVEASVIELRDGALLTANSAGSTAASTPGAPDSSAPNANTALEVRADQRLTLSGKNRDRQGSRIETTALEQSQGRNIVIKAPVMQLTDGATISTASVGTSTAGEIQIEAKQSLELSGGSQITSSTQTSAGGNITVDAGNLIHLRDSSIATGVSSGDGKGGDIHLAQGVLILDGSDVTAHADRGTGGEISITGQSILKSPDSVISAAAGPEGVDGKIETRAPEADFSREIAHPQTAFLDASALLRPRCDAGGAKNTAGTLRVAQQPGLPLSPEELLMAFDSNTEAPRPVVAAQPNAPGDPAVLAEAAFAAGQFEQAGEYWAQASVRADGGAAQSEALRGVAESQQVRGHYDASLDTLNAALAQAQAAQDNAGLAAVQGLIGNAYLALGEADAAARWLRSAIERAQAANEPALEVTLLNNLGNHHMVTQDFAAALHAYETAAHQAREPDQRVKALSNAARAALESGQTDQALTLLTQAREGVRTLNVGHAKVGVLIHVAKSSERLGEAAPSTLRRNFVAAYANLREAVLLSRALNDPRSLSYALGNLGRLYQLDHRAEEALYLTRLAEQAAEQARAPDALYRWYRQSGQLLWAQGEWDAALHAYRRAVAILEESRQETLAQYGAAHARFRQIVAPVYQELVDVLLQRAARYGDADEGAALLLEARATVEQLKAAELRAYFRDECVTELEAKTTRLETVSPYAAVIYPIVLPDRLELLVSLPTGLKRFSVLVPKTTLFAAVRRFRDAVETRDTEARVRVAGRTLYEWLIEPFASELGDVDTLVFVPGGLLRTVPLAALFDGDDYLVQRYRVVVTPGLSLIAPRPFQGGGGKVVLAGLSEAVQDFPALPAVEQELEHVQQIFGGRVLLNESFTAAQLKQSLNEPVSIVHIASHAQFTGNAESSFLLTYDGRLSMADLEEYLSVTRFRAEPLELLVLSACQTAAGDERAALGLAGIGIKAGARSAVGSLWAITDIAASEFVTEFYRQLKDPSASKAQALQSAQQRLLNSKRYAHPYYWSPYLLVNNWL